MAPGDGEGEEPGRESSNGIGVGMAGSVSGMVPSGNGVGLGEVGDFGVGLGREAGVEAVGSGGMPAGVGNGARVGRGAGVPIGAMEGMAPGVGYFDKELSWAFVSVLTARKVPKETNSFFIVSM